MRLSRETSCLELTSTTKYQPEEARDHPTFLVEDDFLEDYDVKETNLSPYFTGGSRVYSDVWYRHFLKPFSACRDRAVPYRDSFKRRVLRPVGIRVAEFAGLHEMFNASHRHYSPLIGVLFNYNNFVDNLYRYGNPDEPAVNLIKTLFHVLPGGEIQTTHLGSCAGAHLSPSIIGVVFEAVERLTPELAENKDEEGRQRLADEFLHLMVNHPDYQEDLMRLIANVNDAESDLEALHKRDSESKPVRDKIKKLEGDVIKIGRHIIKRAETELKAVEDAVRRDRLQAEIALQRIATEEATKEVEKLRAEIVTSLDFKTARKALRRAQDMVDLEKDSRTHLAETLASSFWVYELDTSRRPETLPRFTTTAILLAYVWRKYDSILCLKRYIESMARLGALTCSDATAIALLEAVGSNFSTADTLKDLKLPRRRQDWSAKAVGTAVAIVISKPGVARRPPIVQFSYVGWADYSKFPDCGETALRNLFNQMLYNPATGLFDHGLLLELRDRHYPDMHQKLVNFYTQYPNPQDVSDHAICKAWIDVVSHLNHGREKGLKIRYRREKQQQNIASPLSNVLLVFDALFGIQSLNKVGSQVVVGVVGHINELRGWNLKVDTSAVKKDGFGIVGLTDGKVRYELQSFRPVHFGFVQVETLELDASGRRDYAVFRRLMGYCCGPPSASHDDPTYFEQLCLASMFVPYAFLRNKHRGFFDSCPRHYRMLFADLYKSSQQKTVLRWVRGCHSEDPYLSAIADRIRNYNEPSFLPTSRKSN